MGKNLIQQKRGKGSSTFRAHSFRHKGKPQHPDSTDAMSGEVLDLLHCPGHSAPLAKVRFENKEEGLMIAPEGVAVGDTVQANCGEIEAGNIKQLGDLPTGTLVHNVEARPGDGGKFIRASGTFGRVVAKEDGSVTIQFPSKKRKEFQPDCRASIGVVAGGGRKEKPFLKAGTRYHAFRARNKYYPKVSGAAMNALSHPLGGTRSSRKGSPTIAPRNAPPGAKVGKVRPRRTGKRKK